MLMQFVSRLATATHKLWIVALFALSLATLPLLAEPTQNHKHENAEDTCFICDPAKREKGRLWCREHGRYEDRCWLCHPELEDQNRPYCDEHGLYEDECTLCHPELMEKNSAHNAGKQNSPEKGLFCNEHQVYEKECGICHPELVDELRPGESMKLRFATAESAQKAGIKTTFPEHEDSFSAVEAYCEIGYNQNRLALVTPLTEGIVRRVLVDVGKEVEEGDVLIELHSSAISQAKADYLSAIADHKLKQLIYQRMKKLAGMKVSAEQEFEIAQAEFEMSSFAVERARQHLFNHGFNADEVTAIEKDHDSSSILRIRAPFSGTLVERNAVVGESVEASHTLFKIADLSDMWIELSIPADRTQQIKTGARVEVSFDDFPQLFVSGRITWVATSIDERSRTLKARAVANVPQGTLKAGMFGNASILDNWSNKGISIPRNSLQYVNGKPFLFIKVEDDLYDLRRVDVGNKSDSRVEIVNGVSSIDEVVAQGSFIALSEFLKSRFGAGCCE